MRFYTPRAILFSLILLLPGLFAGLPGVAVAVDPEVLEHLQKARDYRDEGKLKHAVIELKNALQQDPGDPQARLLLGEVYLDLGQGADAENQLRRAGEAGLALGEALLLQGKYSELLEDLDPAEIPPAETAQAHALRGEAHLGLQETEAASAEFMAALAIEPGLTRALLGQARLLLAEDKPDEARTPLETALAVDADDASAWSLLGALEQGQGRKREAEAAYTEALDRNPLLTGARLQRAQMRTELGDFAGAGDDIADVRKQAPKNPGAFYAEGLLHFRQAQFEPATAALGQFLNTYPDDLSTLFYLGLAHYELGNLQQAEQYLSRVVARLPQADDAARYLGVTRLSLDDFSGAETVLRPLVERQPDDVEALRALAKALQGQGKHEQANEYLRQAVILQPESAQERLELAVSRLRLGGDKDEAITEMQQAIALDPELTQGDMLLIRVHLQAGDFDKAIEAAGRLRAKQPDSPDPETLLGIAYAGKGETGKARAAFEEALQKEPGNPSAAINLASMALNEDDLDAARGYYRQVLAQHPDHAQTLLRMAQLESLEGNQEAARARLQEAMEKNPGALQPRIALGRFQLQAGEPLQAVSTLRGAPERYARHPQLLAALGEAQLATGETANAIATLGRLVQARPASARAHYLLASAYVAGRDVASAKRELLAGMRIDPDDVLASWLMTRVSSLQPEMAAKNAWVEELKGTYPEHPQVLDLEAQLALKQGAAREAVIIYRGLHERFPDESVWTLNYANAQLEAGDREGHVATLTTWLDRHPEDLKAQYRLALSYLELERHDEARAAFARVLELQPDNVVALNNQALLLSEKEPQKALAYAERAYELNPDPRIMDTLGIILLQRGETERALQLLEEASRKSPDLATLKYHYAMALAQSGQKDEARKVLKRIADADYPERDEASALLAELEG